MSSTAEEMTGSASTSADRRDFASSLSSFLAEVAGQPSSKGSTPDDLTLWSRLNANFQVAGILVPEHHGGLGLGYAELAVVMESLGAALAPTPIFGSTCLATSLVLAAPEAETTRRILPGLADGTTVATLAWRPPDGAAPVRARLASDEETFLLSGEMVLVPDLMTAEVLLVTADDSADLRVDIGADTSTGGGFGVFMIDATQAGLERRESGTLDATRSFGRLNLHETPARLVVQFDDGRRVLGETLLRASTMLAAEQLGVAQRSLDLCLEFLKVRVQYGRPLASYQVIKHRCVDMYVAIESLRSALLHAMSVDLSTSELPMVGPVLAAHASDVSSMVTTECLHLYGAIGFTWEHHAHRFLKRATVDRQVLGDPTQHREALIQALLSVRAGTRFA